MGVISQEAKTTERSVCFDMKHAGNHFSKGSTYTSVALSLSYLVLSRCVRGPQAKETAEGLEAECSFLLCSPPSAFTLLLSTNISFFLNSQQQGECVL